VAPKSLSLYPLQLTHHVRLSVIMPVLNESRTVRLALNRLLATPMPSPMEVVVVDDGSTDDTWETLLTIDDPRVVLERHEKNRGKGAAVLTGVSVATGTHVLVFDADLEYDPADIPRLLMPVIDGRAFAVFGTRLFGQDTVYQSFWFALGNKLTTLAANVIYDSALTDMHTCLKLLPVQLVRTMSLTDPGFGLDTQITARMLLSGVRPYEISVSYNARTREEGKKIGWKHGWQSLGILVRERQAAIRRPTWMIASREVARCHRIACLERLAEVQEARLAGTGTSAFAHADRIIDLNGAGSARAEGLLGEA
jgi:dolichol-phosphate hexosyltransferase